MIKLASVQDKEYKGYHIPSGWARMYSTAFSTVRNIFVSSGQSCASRSSDLKRTAVDLVGLLVGDLNAELLWELLDIHHILCNWSFPEGKWGAYLLDGHHNLNCVQAVKAKVVGEVGSAVDLYVKRV